VLPEGADTLLQPQRGQFGHREVRAVSLGLQRSGEHHERPLGYLETPEDSGQNPGGQRLHLCRQSEASAKHEASFPSLSAQRSRAVVHSAVGALEKRQRGTLQRLLPAELPRQGRDVLRG